MKLLSVLLPLVALLAGGPTAPAATAPLEGGGGSLRYQVQLENSHVLRARPSVHVLATVEAVREHRGAVRPVNLALVIDRSGSMQGRKIVDARDAALKMLDLLRDGDRVALISYSDDVRVDVESTEVTAASRQRMKDVIRGLHASGSTNLGGGLAAGHEQVRRHLDSDKVNRVLLISDGIANRGVTAVPALNRIAREAMQEGIVTTTLGLGADYNEDLMTSVADHGGGNYYFVAESDALATTLAGEVQQMMATVARQATLEITLPDGVEVEEVYGYAWQKEGPTVVVRLGDVYAGQSRAILWRLRTPEAKGQAALGTLALRYQDLAAGDARRKGEARLAVTVTDDARAVEEHADKDVAARIAEIELATSMAKAAELVQQGRYDDAQDTLKRAATRAREQSRNLGSAGAGLGKSADQAAGMADELEEAPASAEEQKKAVKRYKEGSYRLQKK